MKILAVSKPDKKWRNMYRLTSVGCRSPLDRDRTWQRRDFPNPCRFPDGAISFPVKLQKIPCSDAQGISEYLVEIAELFDAFTWPRNTQRAKIPCIFGPAEGVPLSRRQILGRRPGRFSCRTAFQKPMPAVKLSPVITSPTVQSAGVRSSGRRRIARRMRRAWRRPRRRRRTTPRSRNRSAAQ